jgi:hypothetical protein
MNGWATMVPSTSSFVEPTSHSTKTYFNRHAQLQPRSKFIIHIQLILSSRRIPETARSEAWDWGRSLSGIGGSNAFGSMGIVCCQVFCVGMITRPEESYRVWCVEWAWSWSFIMGSHGSTSSRTASDEKKKTCFEPFLSSAFVFRRNINRHNGIGC